MKVVRADKMGFCHGVRKAFDTVMTLAEQNGNDDSNAIGGGNHVLEGDNGRSHRDKIVILGEIVHNEDVVERVGKSGIESVSNIESVDGKTVVLRTHGEKKATIEALTNMGNALIDCTCVIVKKVREKALELEKRHPVVVIVGKRNHPEIVGLVSWLANPHVVSTDEDIAELQPYRSVGIVSQTTLASDRYAHCVERLEAKYGKWDADEGTGAEWLKTICAHTIRNQDSSAEVARTVDVMIVVGSKHSSNSNKLFEKCVAENPNTLFVQRLSDLDSSALESKKTAGVTSGASTPDWIVDEIVAALEAI